MKLKRITSVLLALVMALSLMPTAFAEGDEGGAAPTYPVTVTIGEGEPVGYSTLKEALEFAKENSGAVIDLQNGTFDLTDSDNQCSWADPQFTKGIIDILADVTIKNGTFTISGVTAQESIFHVWNANATFENVKFEGNGFSSGNGVIYANVTDGTSASVTLNKCTFNLTNDTSDGGGVLKGLYPISSTTFNVTDCTFNLTNMTRVFAAINLTMKDSTVDAKISAEDWVTAGSHTTPIANNGFRNVFGTIESSTITIDGHENGLKNDADKTLAIKNGSTVTLSNSGTEEEPDGKDLSLKVLNENMVSVDGTSNLIFTSSDIKSPAGKTYVFLYFDTNGGKLPEETNLALFLESGETIDLSNYTPTRSGYRFGGWEEADGNVVSGDYPKEETKIETNTLTLTAKWKKKSSGSSQKYTVTIEEAEGGEVTANGTRAAKGQVITLTVTAEDGYTLKKLTALDKDENKVKLTAQDDGTYTFTMPASNVTVTATFAPETAPFADVPLNSYFLKPVKWAVENGITTGVTDDTFDPYGACTRAQAVTFLWRAAGSPAPKGTVMPFADVPANSYFHDAVLWAVENGIATGVTADTFAPYTVCTRAHIVTFLFRYAAVMGMDAVTMQELVSGYDDAASVPGYALSAFNWALYTGVTQGNDGKLLPGDNCTRAQIVTFLYRYCN